MNRGRNSSKCRRRNQGYRIGAGFVICLSLQNRHLATLHGQSFHADFLHAKKISLARPSSSQKNLTPVDTSKQVQMGTTGVSVK
jgi:hypothetical protein